MLAIFIILLVFWLVIKGQIGISAIALLPILFVNVFLVISVSFVLATIGVFFLDIARIWGILMSLGFFLTPIFYTLDMLDPLKRRVLLINPMTHIIIATRDVLIGNTFPKLPGLGYVLLLSICTFFAGYKAFKLKEGYFVEKI